MVWKGISIQIDTWCWRLQNVLKHDHLRQLAQHLIIMMVFLIYKHWDSHQCYTAHTLCWDCVNCGKATQLIHCAQIVWSVGELCDMWESYTAHTLCWDCVNCGRRRLKHMLHRSHCAEIVWSMGGGDYSTVLNFSLIFLDFSIELGSQFNPA